jgi:hypothetical protein
MIAQPRSNVLSVAVAVLSIVSVNALEPAVFASPVPSAVVERIAPTGNGCGQFAEYAPYFTLKDPNGKEYSSDKLYGDNGMMIMITVPNLSQFEKQKRWEKWLLKQKWPEQNKCQCVVLQDLSQQKSFKEKARSLMKEKYAKGVDFILLVDENGATRKKFNVMENETVILVVDREGRVIHHETDQEDSEAAAARRIAVQAHWLVKTKPMQQRTVAVK